MFDPACLSLAEHFLPPAATDERRREFAEWIQHHVELWMFGVCEVCGEEHGEDPCLLRQEIEA